MGTYDLVADRRRALADVLAGLDDEQWRTPSLCDGWEVRHVVGHLQLPWSVSMPALMWALVRHRGYDAANLQLSRDLGERPRGSLVDGLRDHADNRRTAPGQPPESLLTDVVVHTADILVPLGMSLPAPPESLVLVLDYLVSAKAKSVQPPGGIDGLRFRATDVAWAHGDGPEVAGTGVDLAAALCGRPALVERLTGDGVPEFARRFD